MPKLSLIKAEAERLVGRLSEPRRFQLQKDLVDMCEERWREIRGPEPATPLAHGLWSITPPLVDLFADLYAGNDDRLDDLLQGHRPEWGLALLVLAEIERNDAEGARLAHELMMVFESTELDVRYSERIAAALRGGLEPTPLPRQLLRQPLWQAMEVMTSHIKRWDVKALAMVIRLLSSVPVETDQGIDQLRSQLEGIGIRFLGVDEKSVFYQQHGREHKPVSLNELAETLFVIRQATLG